MPLLLVGVAFLVLFLSCPVVKMLQYAHGGRPAVGTRAKARVAQATAAARYAASSVSCCSLKNKSPYDRLTTVQQSKPTPSADFFFFSEQSGFGIQHALA